MVKVGAVLINLAGLSACGISQIIESRIDFDELVVANEARLLSFGLLANDVGKILKIRRSSALENELKLIEKEKIECLDISQDSYPEILRQISRPPVLLYLQGDVSLLNTYIIGVVGTRLPTIYGQTTAEKFSFQMSSASITVISGLATGIDTAAHQGALKGGKTIAVLGSGLLNVYPKSNFGLAKQIIEKGLLVSEFPLLMPPLKENFPRRNRIVSGLSRAVLVVEASLKSGALITAHLALEQGREVFAVPGEISSVSSKGPHQLIKEGAMLVESFEDIANALNLTFQVADQTAVGLVGNPDEERFLNLFKGSKELNFAQLSAKSGLESSFLNKIVLDLQLKGFIKEIKPASYVRTF